MIRFEGFMIGRYDDQYLVYKETELVGSFDSPEEVVDFIHAKKPLNFSCAFIDDMYFEGEREIVDSPVSRQFCELWRKHNADFTSNR